MRMTPNLDPAQPDHGDDKAEVVYGIEPTQRANDPAVLGTALGLTEPSEPFSLNNPHLVMAAGNGEVWVADNGRDIQPGDYLISSQVPGHAMVDDRAEDESHIIGRAGESVRWAEVSDVTNGVKHKKISILFGAFTRDNRHSAERLARLESKLAQLESLVLRLTAGSSELLSEN